MNQPKLCRDCEGGPQGLEGHANLVLYVQAAPQSRHRGAFRCAVCGAEWLRTYTGSGSFFWHQDAPSP